ncbi:hypothetical protein NUW58_g6582 [Xylaria curta]|uniref:Uncharacterized protein n=1 Tax=Xylaria curta TaxID=42375 RepID=A0ACC1NRA7_9PEZI|nr:hypothetical protein NUW58_g6582 [Xylaria curta]
MDAKIDEIMDAITDAIMDAGMGARMEDVIMDAKLEAIMNEMMNDANLRALAAELWQRERRGEIWRRIATIVPQEITSEDRKSRMLPLAIRSNRAEVVEILLQQGANANKKPTNPLWIDPIVRCQDETIIRLLLDHGADIPSVEILFGNHPSREEVAILQRLKCAAGSYLSEKARSRRFLIRRLRCAFEKEHESMTQAAQAPTGPTGDWALGFETDPNTAWDLGIQTLKCLHSGQLPSSLNETLLLLGLVKSMGPIVGGTNSDQLELEFLDDLPRWQILYDEDPPALISFQEALSKFWFVDVTSWQRESHDADMIVKTLQHFKHVAQEFFSLITAYCGMSHMSDVNAWETLAAHAR